MEKYHFVKKINGTDETGIMDIESQKLICLCTEENSELLLKALRQPLVLAEVILPKWDVSFVDLNRNNGMFKAVNVRLRNCSLHYNEAVNEYYLRYGDVTYGMHDVYNFR